MSAVTLNRLILSTMSRIMNGLGGLPVYCHPILLLALQTIAFVHSK